MVFLWGFTVLDKTKKWYLLINIQFCNVYYKSLQFFQDLVWKSTILQSLLFFSCIFLSQFLYYKSLRVCSVYYENLQFWSVCDKHFAICSKSFLQFYSVYYKKKREKKKNHISNPLNKDPILIVMIFLTFF